MCLVWKAVLMIILAFDWALGAKARPKGVTKVMQFKEFASFMNIIKGLVTKTNLDNISILGGSLVLFNRFSRVCVIYSENKFSICFFGHITEKGVLEKGRTIG